MFSQNKKDAKKEQRYWDEDRQAAYQHQRMLGYHGYRMGVMDSQIEQERAKTKQLERERLKRAEEQRTKKFSKNSSSVTTPTPYNSGNNKNDVTTFPSFFSSSSSSNPINYSSANSYSNSTQIGYDAFKQARSVSTPPPQNVSQVSAETQTTFSRDPFNATFTEMSIERKPNPIKFAPRLHPPSLEMTYKTSDFTKWPNTAPTSKVSSVKKNSDDSEFYKFEQKYELLKQQQQEEARERKRKEEEQLKAIKMAIQYNPIKLPKIPQNQGFHYSHDPKPPPSMRRNSVPSMYHQQMSSEYNQKSKENVKVVAPGIGVIGLPKTGRTFLIGALAGGIWPKDLTPENPIIAKNGAAIYKLNHPNNGFINGSIDENQPIYDHFFLSSNLSCLSLLILTIDGAIREEDFLILCLAKQYNISTVIVRTKLDEWLDNLPRGHSKEGYVEADKQFVVKSLKELNMYFPKNRIFNISALAMVRISEEGPGSEMKKYKQDEDALFTFLQEFGYKDVKKHSEIINVDIVILGLKSSGKSSIAESLRQYLNLSQLEKHIYEIEYSEMLDVNEIITKIKNTNSKIYIFVVPNTVGRMDAELSKYLINSNKNVCIVLNKSDEMIDNLKKQQNFFGNDDYVKKRLEAAQREFIKVGIEPINLPCYSVSTFVLTGFLDNTYATQEQAFLNYLRHVLCRKA